MRYALVRYSPGNRVAAVRCRELASLAVPKWAVEQWPLRERPDWLLGQVYEFGEALHREATPEYSRPPLDAEIAWARNMPSMEDGILLVARDGAGTIAGTAQCGVTELAGWKHILKVRVEVDPAVRRQGLGRMLAARSADAAAADGLRLVCGRTRGRVPAGSAFCRALHTEPVQVIRENRLDLQTIDRGLVDRWLAEGPARAPGYVLIFVPGRTPDDMVEQAVAALNIMNDAPRDGLDIGDSWLTVRQLRDYEQAGDGAGVTRWAYYAADKGTGQFVGLSDISIDPGCPDRVSVGDTAVHPDHRGTGLGKWLKAAITDRVLRELPQVRWVITGNSSTNIPMLAINRQLGFHPADDMTTWQVATTDLLAALTGNPR